MTAARSIRIAGAPRELGRAQGTALRAPIHAFLSDDLCRLNRLLDRPTSLNDHAAAIRSHAEIIARDTPHLHEEISGLAEGAGIERNAAFLLQLRREIMGYSRWHTGGDCTTLCLRGKRGPLLAQTIDLNGDLDDHMVVAEITHAAPRRCVLVLTFTGLLGYLGLNADGLAIGINLVLGGTWQAGIPPYLAVRYLLDQCRDVASALDGLKRLTLASSRALTICDRHDAVTVECIDGEIVVLRDVPLVHTNHFLDRSLAAKDQINPFARNASIARLKACRERLAALRTATPEEVMALFCEAPIRVKNHGDCRRERTVGAVVMLPAEGRMDVRCGDPFEASTVTFQL